MASEADRVGLTPTGGTMRRLEVRIFYFINMNTKICNKCGKEKPLDQFVKNSSKSDGHSNQCINCRHDYYKKYYALNKKRILEKHK